MTLPSPSVFAVPPALQPLAVLAWLLERLERQPRQASATQYRQVVQQIQQLLTQAAPDAELDRLLQAMPATAEVYENLHYAQAGLCRAPLQRALDAELSAAASIRRARACG